MRTKRVIYEYLVPDWALCSLINGDESGMDDEDSERLKKFTDKIIEKHGHANFILSDNGSRGFWRVNDVDSYGSDCTEVLLLVDDPVIYAISQIISEVSTKYGAPMGRSDKGTKPAKGKIFDRAVPMSEPGYDKGGAYWGIGGELRVEYTKDLSYIHFYRR